MADLLRVSLSGALPGGEEWSVNPCFSLGGDFGEPVSAAQASAIATAISGLTLGAGIQALMLTNTSWSGVRVEARTRDGQLQALGEAVRATPTLGTGTTPHPYQTSVVTSLRTALPGASGRGRLYWPANGVAINSSNLRIGSPIPANLAAAVKTLLTAMDGAITAQLTGAVAPVVWSRTRQLLTPITAIQVGDITDVQRRRRDILVENYTAVSYP